MKRVLSLLLLIPFLTVQAWAIRGGPFESLNGRSMSAVSGTYGLVMNGTQDSADTGVMTMSIPSAGMASGRILIFSKGRMYLGNAQGTVDVRNGAVTLLSQMSHYAAHVVSDGIQKQSGVVVDSILTGKMRMGLSLDYLSGLIEVKGSASYYEYDPMLTKVVLNSTTETVGTNGVINQNSNSNKTANDNAQSATVSTNTTSNSLTNSSTAGNNASTTTTSTAGQDSTTNSTTTTGLNQSTSATTTATISNPDNSSTSTSDTTGTTKTVNGTSSEGTNANSVQTQTTGTTQSSNTTQTNTTGKNDTTTSAADKSTGNTLTQGSTVVAGTTNTSSKTITTTTYDPSAVKQPTTATSATYMKFDLDGVRDDTTVATLSPFAPPTEATLFQVEVAAPATGGGTGTGGGTNTPTRTGP